MDELQKELDATKAELAKLRAERDGMAAQASQRAIADQIASALSRRIDSRAAFEMSRVLAAEVKTSSDGRLWHEELCASTPDAIADAYLDGKGSYLLQTAPINGRQTTPAAPAEPAWDIAKAAADLAYDQKWQRADPEGNKKAWREHLASMSRPHYG